MTDNRKEDIEMSKKSRSQSKENFNQAMYDMFGIGRETEEEEEEELEDLETVSSPAAPFKNEPAPAPTARGSYVEPPRGSMHRGMGTYFAEGTSIEGTLRCDGDLELCGDFKGELIAKGKVTIHASTTSNVAAAELALVDCTLTGDATVTGNVNIDGNSSINGNVRATNVVCSGVVRGNLHVAENITLTEKAQVYGDISTDTLAISRGAKISGKIEMGLNSN